MPAFALVSAVVEPPAGNRTGDPILTMQPLGTAVRTPCFPRSRPTVRAKVIGSLSAQLCAHFNPCAGRLTGVAAAPVEAPVHHLLDAAARHARAPRRRGI